MGSKTVIYSSISFIENQLSQELNINELAGQAFFSKTHYQRLFQAVVGAPVMEYIKKRRLQRAGMALCETDASVLEIALEYGYASHEGFSRAFREHFGMPPLQYRKRYATIKTKPYHGEVTNMITNEARENIMRYTGEVTKDWEALVTELEKWITPAKHEIEKAGRNACGMKVAFKEWVHLAERINAAKNETQKLFAENTNVYDLYDKADKLMKVLDDINFQMNLLCFLTGVEWVRMGEHGAPFEPILKGLSALCESEENRKQAAVRLVIEINGQVQAEIKREAVSCIQQAAELLREAVRDGASLTEKLNTLVIKLGAYGRGFSLIARETEKSTACVREIELFMTGLADEMVKSGSTAFSASNKNPVHMSLKRLADNAFKMNVNAFNAAVESARAGETEDCDGCARGVMAYAGQLQRTYKICEELNSDCAKLMALICDKDENTESRRYHKQLDDIIFQAGFLNIQLSLESERANRDGFRALSQEFEKALESLKNEQQCDGQTSKTDILKSYSENISVLIERGKKEAKAEGNFGVGIGYILNEYSRLKRFLLLILH